MGFDQYHEPPEELPAETRTFARLCASLTEEAEAIGWYEQRLAVEPDAEARSVMADARHEEFKHFAMDLEFLLRRKPEWGQICRGILFKDGEITENGEDAEGGVEVGASGPVDVPGGILGDERSAAPSPPAPGGSLGIGSLKGASR